MCNLKQADLICGQLCLARLAWQGVYQDGVAGQLGRQGDPFPVCATICGMQQYSWPAHNPTFLAIEAD